VYSKSVFHFQSRESATSSLTHWQILHMRFTSGTSPVHLRHHTLSSAPSSFFLSDNLFFCRTTRNRNRGKSRRMEVHQIRSRVRPTREHTAWWKRGLGGGERR